jgi:hypothetical protein
LCPLFILTEASSVEIELALVLASDLSITPMVLRRVGGVDGAEDGLIESA